MTVSIIDRTEQKYFLTDYQYCQLFKQIQDKIEEDIYFKETIYNLYFDNDEYELINRSINKPIYKEKVRLRSYEKPNSDTLVFLEIKKKFQDVSNKRRIELTYAEALNYIEKGLVPHHDKQITKEIDYCFKSYHLKPKIRILYDRVAYHLVNDDTFRITFDHNIHYNTNYLQLLEDDSDKMLFESGYIMEIKTLRALPIWLSDMLLQLKIYPISYSKVGKVYEQIRRCDDYVS